jgi:WD40 repeat protein
VQTTVAHQARPVSAISFDVKGQILACAGETRNSASRLGDPEITLWETATWQRMRRYPIPRKSRADVCTSVAFHPSGGSIASGWFTSDRILIFNTSTVDEPHTIQVDDPRALAFSRDGTRLWAAAGETVRTWSVPDWREQPGWSNAGSRIISGRMSIYCLTVGRDWALAGGRDGAIREFTAPEGPQLRRSWTCSEEPVTSVSLDAAEQIAAVGTQDGDVALFRIPSGEPIARREKAHQDTVEAMGFFPGGRLLVTGSKDHTIRLWRVADESLDEVLTLRSPTGPIHSVRSSPDGQDLFTVARGEPAVRVWHLGKLRERLKPLNLDWQ